MANGLMHEYLMEDGNLLSDQKVGWDFAISPEFRDAFKNFAPSVDTQTLLDQLTTYYKNEDAIKLGKVLKDAIMEKAVIQQIKADNSTTNLVFNGNVDISVKADALPDGDSPTAAPDGSTEQTAIVIRSINSGVTNVTFKKDLTVKATAPNEANGLSLQAQGGTINFTADGKVTAKAEGTSPAAGYGVEVASDNGGTTTAKFNKGLDTEGSTHGLYVRSVQKDNHNPNQKFGTSTATVEGGDVRIVSQKAPLYNTSATSDLAGAILVDGKNTSLTVNKDGGHKVEVVGDINTTMDGKVSLNLDTAGSSIKGNIHAFNESQSDISLSGEGNDLTGAAQSGLYFDTGTTGTLNLALKDGAAWKVTDVSDATTLSLDNGAVLDMTQPMAEEVADQNNAQGNGLGYQVVHVKDLKGDNGIVRLDIDPTKNTENSDQVYVSGDFTGTHEIGLKLASEGDVSAAEGTILARVKNNNGTFTAKDEEGTLVWNHFVLDKKADDVAGTSIPEGRFDTDWYLKKIDQADPLDRPTTVMNTIISSRALTYGTWRGQIADDKLLQRMGELRRNGEQEQGTWFRAKHGTYKHDGPFRYSNKTTRYELGYDYQAANHPGLTRYVGASVFWDNGDTDYTFGTDKNKNRGIALYSTDLYENGGYLDLVARFQRLKNDVKAVDKDGNAFTADGRNTGYSISAEYGRRFDLEDKFFIEPQVQLTAGHLNGNSYRTSNGIAVDNSSINSVIGRLGFNLGTKLGDRGTAYVKANVLHEFGGSYDDKFTYSGQTVGADSDFRDTWFQYGLGATYQTGANSDLYLDLEKTSGGDFSQNWVWNAGVRFSF